MLLVAVMAMGLLAGCGQEADGEQKKEVQAPNTKTASFEEMVEYLQSEGFIKEEVEPVDINATTGYLTDNTGGAFTQTQLADKAYDYDGLWLFWWDTENQTENYEYYEGMAVNSGTIVLGGGAAILATEAVNGAFAIAFSQDYANKEQVLEVFKALKSE